VPDSSIEERAFAIDLGVVEDAVGLALGWRLTRWRLGARSGGRNWNAEYQVAWFSSIPFGRRTGVSASDQRFRSSRMASSVLWERDSPEVSSA